MASEKKAPFPLNLKLDREKDADIIEFLEDKPNAYIVRLALRRFMNDSRDVLSDTPKARTEKENTEVEASDIMQW